MPENLTSGDFNLVSLLDGYPFAGIASPASNQGPVNIVLNAETRDWHFEEQNGSNYRFSIGQYSFTGFPEPEQKPIFATDNFVDNVDWHTVYHSEQDAYTIELPDSPPPHMVWTVQYDLNPHPMIQLQSTDGYESDPPKFVDAQLFIFWYDNPE